MNINTKQRTLNKDERQVQFNFRLPESMILKIKKYAIKNNKSQSLVVEEALKVFFNK